MTNYKELYEKKRITAAEAAALVRSGDWVDYGWCTNQTVAIDAALAARKDELEDVKIRTGVSLWLAEVLKADPTGEHFQVNTWHAGGADRKLINSGNGFYIPLRYSEIARFYRENADKARVLFMQVSPMDKNGYFNVGPNGSHNRALVDCAELVVVEVNENMPRCVGGLETQVSINQVDYIVEGDNPPIAALPKGTPTEVDMAVAKLVVPEIPNGACIQLGIGGMPNAIGQMIADSDLKDLGVHTEMYVDGFVAMTRAGKITGAKKNVDRYRQTYAFGAGSQEMYDFLDNNPECNCVGVDYVNDARTISQLDNFMSINNAIDVDLFGQIASETSGLRHISGAGGQLDFVLGAYLSKGGKSFMCFSSTITKKDGTLVSRIMPTLAEGSIVTCTRTNAHYLVTEYGMFNCKGKTTWQRAEGIIGLAHPQFRDELIASAEKMGIWRKSNKR